MRRLLFIGFFGGNTGYINASKVYPLAAKAAGFNVGIIPLSGEVDERLRPLIAKGPEKDDIRLLHQIPTVDPTADAYFTVTEFNCIPHEWILPIAKSEFILTQSRFCKDVIGQHFDKKKIGIVYAPVNPNFSPVGDKMNLTVNGKKLSEYKCVFGSTLEWVARKKPELMWQAFLEEFPNQDDVCFLNRMSIPQGFRNWKWIYNAVTKKDKRFALLNPIQDIGNFYRSLNGYVSCTAGEGFGLTLAEAMSCGIPTIASKHSGNLEFMNDKNSWLVDVDPWSYIGNDPTNKLWMVHDYQQWRLPKIDSIRKAMREIYEGKLGTKPQEALRVKDLCSFDKITEQMQKALVDKL
jgi:glycosyltransferase involved in cell wall biosynthesis